MNVMWPTMVNDNLYQYCLKIGLNKAVFTVLHVQTKHDNWHFSSKKVESFGNLV